MARVACSNGRRGGEGERKKKRYLERCFGILREVVIFVLRNDLGETCYRIIISFSSLFSFFLPEFFEEESSLGETIDDSRRDYFFFFFFSFFSLLCKMFKEFFFVVSLSSLLEGRKLGVLFLSCKIVGGKLLVCFLILSC